MEKIKENFQIDNFLENSKKKVGVFFNLRLIYILRSLLITLFRLGPVNVTSVLLYKFAIRFRFTEKLLPLGESYIDPLFHILDTSNEIPIDSVSRNSILQKAQELFNGRMCFFSHRFLDVGSPPDWFLNPFNGKRFSHADIHWSKLPDFDSGIGDIKCIWEPSRFDWTLILARAYRLTGDGSYVDLLNEWVSDWTKNNPLNVDSNWKCGQETAIRMMHVLLAAYLLHQHNAPTPGLRRFVIEHCSRIAPTIRYAIAQDNNHGTSETAALYIGGAWLLSCCPEGRSTKLALRWHRLGKRWLENRVRKLIASDGSFSQYSLNYHRVLLDTLNIVEFWRRELQLPRFSETFYECAKTAVYWLYQMIDSETGDGPNLGANDGARLFALSSTNYRDYRPSVQLGAILFLGQKVYHEGQYDEPLIWLGLKKSPSPPPSHQGRGTDLGSGQISPSLVGGVGGGGNKISSVDLKLTRKSCIMRDGGYVLMHFNTSWAVIRFPNFQFRPGHADALHLDLWHNGINLLRDSGSYSYNTDEPWQNYFSSTAAHTTVQFDERDQMPRLGRFLFGDWLHMEQIGELINNDSPLEGGRGVSLSWTGSYIDYKNCRHKRIVSSNGFMWKIVDEIEGYDTKAELRWRLAPGNWEVNGLKCVGDMATLSVDSTVPICRFELVEGWESQYYLKKSKLPVLEVQIEKSKATLITEIRFK